MSYNVIPTERFKKEAKRLIKKYPSLKNELLDLGNELSENPSIGVSLGNNTFKVRIAIKSKGEGEKRRCTCYNLSGYTKCRDLNAYHI